MSEPGERDHPSVGSRHRLAVIVLSIVLGSSSGLALAAPPVDPMTSPPPAGYYVFQKVVYQNDGGGPDDHAYFQRFLRNISAHIEATDGKVEIRVVSFAAGVKLFQMAKTDPALAGDLDRLRGKGVRFMICRNTLKGMGWLPADLYGVQGADIVPSGVAELARLQGLGYVYIHP
jgi:intracellular sulfur oxidation DsrE/DsrF family protein